MPGILGSLSIKKYARTLMQWLENILPSLCKITPNLLSEKCQTKTRTISILKKDKRHSDPWDFVIGTSHLLIGGGASVIFSRKGRC